MIATEFRSVLADPPGFSSNPQIPQADSAPRGMNTNRGRALSSGTPQRHPVGAPPPRCAGQQVSAPCAIDATTGMIWEAIVRR